MQLTVKLALKEWQFADGSKAVASYMPSNIIHMQQQTMLGTYPSLNVHTGRKLKICTVEGRNLAPMDRTGKSDPYLKLFYGKVVSPSPSCVCLLRHDNCSLFISFLHILIFSSHGEWPGIYLWLSLFVFLSVCL